MPNTDAVGRLDQLAHIEAIKHLKYRYWRACDAKDPSGFRSCFIQKGARIDYGPLGTFDDAEPMAQIFEQVALHRVDGQYVILDMHHGFHPDIALTSDTTATGRWTLKFRQVNLLDRTETVMAGEYSDEYVVEDGEWKMAASTLTERWSVRRPLGDDATVRTGTFASRPE
ncbi:nuclear transport factor 2 family protein [Gordonia terrae]|uniref:nuclear transport factor 2 family protein n=1 Tax=Gordonia terrae TaxID=2055 RepID=UPI003F6D03B0